MGTWWRIAGRREMLVTIEPLAGRRYVTERTRYPV
jgi:hypothetical protein